MPNAIGTTSRVSRAGTLILVFMVTWMALASRTAMANQPPTASLYPIAGGPNFLPGVTVRLAATTSDPDQNVTQVEFLANGAVIATKPIPPGGSFAEYFWVDVPAGTYSITARATDAFGATGTSAPVPMNVDVAYNQPPTASISNPANNATFAPGQTVYISGSGIDTDNNLVKIEYLANGTVLHTADFGSTCCAGGSYNWTNVPAGTHSLAVRATDVFGAVATSASRSITMTNTAPSVTLTSPTAYLTVVLPEPVVLSATASDADGAVAKVEFFQGATLVGTVTNPPYTMSLPSMSPGTYAFTARATDNLGATTVTGAVEITVAHPSSRTNVAAQANGGVASASSTFNVAYPAASANNGDRKGLNWSAGGGWMDANGGFPDWLQIDFNGQKTINEIDIFTIQDNYTAPAEPTADMTFSLYGVWNYDVQSWDGQSWVTVPGGSVTWNNKVWRRFSFPAVTTDRIRVLVHMAPYTYSRLIEIEAWSVSAPANQAPTVALSEPAGGSGFQPGANVRVSASASDGDGSVARVDFYAGGNLIGSATGAPYSIAWSNVPAGTHSLTAWATDDQGLSSVSAPLEIAVQAAQAYYIHADHLDTPRLVADQQGQTLWRWDNNEAFGAHPAEEDPDGNGQAFVFNLRFPGQYLDRETGMHYNYFRDYDPEVGRYLESDPIGLVGGVNTYLYANAAPTMYTDPEGLRPPGPQPALIFRPRLYPPGPAGRVPPVPPEWRWENEWIHQYREGYWNYICADYSCPNRNPPQCTPTNPNGDPYTWSRGPFLSAPGWSPGEKSGCTCNRREWVWSPGVANPPFWTNAPRPGL